MTIADRHERRESEIAPVVPAFGYDLGTDPCRIAERDCEWWNQRTSHGDGP